MKKTIKGLWIALAISMIAFVAVYILLGFYYMEGFPCFTWINGVYCTGKTVDEVNDELCSKYEYDGIKVIDATGAELYISKSDVNLTIDFKDSLNTYLEDKNPFAWGFYFFNGLVANFSPAVTVDEVLLANKVANWEIFVPLDELTIDICKSKDSGYILNNELDLVPAKDNIIYVVEREMLGLKNEVRLSSADGCYSSAAMNDEQQHVYELFKIIDKIQNCSITYTVAGNSIQINRNVVADWIVCSSDIKAMEEEKTSKKIIGSGLYIADFEEKKYNDFEEITDDNGFAVDENGNIIISEKKMFDFIAGLASEYGTSGMLEKYRNGECSEIIINDNSKGDGTIYDIASEFEFLKNAYIEETYDKEVVRNWNLSDTAVSYNADEKLGNTYIEINMGKQMLYYYVDGVLNMDMPIVTGNVNRSRGTPTGIYPVYNKRYHTNLIGTDYVSYVNYWLGVHKGVGIHDATWRSKFGDDIYKRDGSHGCINCPLESVEGLWEVVDVGTPVILYY